jgi:ribosomal protein S18 acetylase RimI-like enzyme
MRRALRAAAELRRQHGMLRAAWLFTVRSLARLSGATVLACMHKPVGKAGQGGARLLTRAELERASMDPALDLPPEFVASTHSAQCFGVVVDGNVRAYAWTAAEPVRAMPGTVVRMPSGSAYVFKAFTDPAFRGRGLLRECLSAVEQHAVRDGRAEMSTLVEIHNRSSLRAFGSAGFKRCGLVFVLKRPWVVKKLACTCSASCNWSATSV